MLTIVVLLLEVHVNDTTRPDTSHLVTKESTNILEQTGLGVATIFREENGNVVRAELLGTVGISGALEAVPTTPFVDVETEEVNTVLVRTAVEVVLDIFTNVGIIIGSVTNVKRTVGGMRSVGLHITNSSLDESAGSSVGGVVANFVTGEETESVRVLGKRVNNGGVTLEQVDVPFGVFTRDSLGRTGQIGQNVDTSITKSLHTLVMVGSRVDRVNTDKVCLETLKDRNITRATSWVTQWIRRVLRLTGLLLLVGNTLDEEFRSVTLVEEVITLDNERVCSLSRDNWSQKKATKS